MAKDSQSHYHKASQYQGRFPGEKDIRGVPMEGRETRSKKGRSFLAGGQA